MTDTPEPWKLLLCMVQFVHVLSFATEEAANEADDFFTKMGYHTMIVNDAVVEEEEPEAPDA